MFNLLIIVAQFLVPLGLLAWLAFGRASSRVGWMVKTTLAGLYLFAIALAGVWQAHPWFIPGVYIVALFLTSARSLPRVRNEPAWPTSRRAWLATGIQGVMCALLAVLAIYVVSGRRPPHAPVVDLAFPLAGGTYYVVNGGSTELLNAHIMTLSGERFRKWRGQSYGVDLLKLNRWGLRARGVRPEDPAAYVIFGEPVLAPCAGTVIAAVDGLRDLSPPRVDREHMAGNHVILGCGDAWIVLGHFREGSVCVGVGDSVQTGQRVGSVGNTGNSDEPHLHIHAQRPGTAEAPLGGEPLVVRFQGRYLIRNARITQAPAERILQSPGS